MKPAPIYYEYTRPLTERLFSLPWRPSVKAVRLRDWDAEDDRDAAYEASERRARARDPWPATIAALGAPDRDAWPAIVRSLA